MELGRDAICAAIRRAIEPLSYAVAMREGGSAAWGREDRWSDIDLQVLVEDDRVSDAIAAVDAALEALSPSELRLEAPRPTWHGHEQVFYRLRDAGEYCLVDLAVMKRSAPQQLRERERHGERRVFFDKTGEARPATLDRERHDRLVAERLRHLSVALPMFQSLTKKETLLRIRYCPDRFDFGPRYAVVDLPREVLQRVEPL